MLYHHSLHVFTCFQVFWRQTVLTGFVKKLTKINKSMKNITFLMLTHLTVLHKNCQKSIKNSCLKGISLRKPPFHAWYTGPVKYAQKLKEIRAKRGNPSVTSWFLHNIQAAILKAIGHHRGYFSTTNGLFAAGYSSIGPIFRWVQWLVGCK